MARDRTGILSVFDVMLRWIEKYFWAVCVAVTLLGLFVPATAGFFVALKLQWCSRCMNFACPLNGVADDARTAFLARNPGVSRAWAAARGPGNPVPLEAIDDR